MVDVAQSVRVTDCGSEGRGFESHLPPKNRRKVKALRFFLYQFLDCEQQGKALSGANYVCEVAYPNE